MLFRSVSYYPVSIPAHGMALNVTVQGYNGRLDYGLIACRKAVSDISELGDFILAAHQELLVAVADLSQTAATPPRVLPLEAPVVEAPPKRARRKPRLVATARS